MLGLIDPQFFETLFADIFAKDRKALIAQLKTLEAFEAEMVVDELTSWLKERLYSGDGRFSPLILERFFRILSEAKSLFAINADGAFVLGLVFFKMLEALKVKEIDQMIESLEAQVQRPDSVDFSPKEVAPATAETPPATTADAKTQPPPAAKPAADPALKKFEALCARIADRSAELGTCFKEQIRFISYADNTLTWESCADETCKGKLKHGYPVIKQLVREVFGFETAIKHNPCSQKEATPEPEAKPAEPEPTMTETPPEPEERPAFMESYETPSVQPEPEPAPIPPEMPSPQTQTPAPESETTAEAPQSGSMTEEVEAGSGSCVTGCSSEDIGTKEFDGGDILEQPMIKKATELFEATKITIQNKV